MSTTVTWARSKSTLWASGLGMSARIRWRRWDRGVQPAQEGVDGAGADGPPAPLVEPVGVDLVLDQLDQVVEGADHLAVDADGPVAHRLGLPQAGGHVVDDHRVLLAVVLGVGEQEREQLVGAELGEGPEERGDVPLAGGDVGAGVGVVPRRRGEEGDRAERPRGQAEAGVAGGWSGPRPRWRGRGTQVLALDVEDEGLGVGRLGAEGARVEQAVEQEGGVAGLGGHAGDPADVHVRAPGAVEELEVQVERLVVRDRPAGRRLRISENSSASSRSAPVALRTSSPGRGGT